jgi:hypothetical protein
MAGTVTVRCDGCRKPVMVADRDGQIGNAWDSTVVSDPAGAPVATCALCHATTPWKPRETLAAPATVPWSLANAHARNAPICQEVDHDPLEPMPTVSRGTKVNRTCQRCGAVYSKLVV